MNTHMLTAEQQAHLSSRAHGTWRCAATGRRCSAPACGRSP